MYKLFFMVIIKLDYLKHLIFRCLYYLFIILTIKIKLDKFNCINFQYNISFDNILININ